MYIRLKKDRIINIYFAIDIIVLHYQESEISQCKQFLILLNINLCFANLLKNN